MGRLDLWSKVVLPQLCGAIYCIISSLKSPVLHKSNWTLTNGQVITRDTPWLMFFHSRFAGYRVRGELCVRSLRAVKSSNQIFLHDSMIVKAYFAISFLKENCFLGLRVCETTLFHHHPQKVSPKEKLSRITALSHFDIKKLQCPLEALL